MHFGDGSVHSAADSDGRLIGHDVDHVLVLNHGVSNGDMPSGNLAFDHTFTDIGQFEHMRSHSHSSIVACIASVIRA